MTIDEQYRRTKLHFVYCMVIAAIFFIGEATSTWSKQKDFTVYLSNAATMTSLFLGLVAIFYSFISNNGLSQSLGSISTVASDVKESRSQIAHFIEVTKQAASEGQERARDIKLLSDDIRDNLEQVKLSIGTVARQHSELNSVLAQIPKGFDDLRDTVGKAFAEKTSVVDDGSHFVSHLNRHAIERFIYNSSKYGMFAIYAITLAFKSKKLISPSIISNAIRVGDDSNSDYFLAYMVSMNAFDIIDFVEKDSEDSMFAIDGMNSHLTSLSLDREKMFVFMGLSDGEKERWIPIFDRIEEKFKGSQVPATKADGG